MADIWHAGAAAGPGYENFGLLTCRAHSALRTVSECDIITRGLLQVLTVAWLIATVFFVVCYASPCQKLPPRTQLQFFELGGGDQDIFAGVDDTDARGLKHFPRLW